MDLPVVLSHKTAWQLYHSRAVIERRAMWPSSAHEPLARPGGAAAALSIDPAETPADLDPLFVDFGLGHVSTSPRAIALALRQAASSFGISRFGNDPLDLLVSFPSDRTGSKAVVTHVFGNLISSELVVPLAPGALMVCEPLCFVQAATWMTQLELIEFGYELCGRYTVIENGDYIEHEPFLSRAGLRAWIDAHPHAPGAQRARRALASIRDGSRSPMETGTAMMVACPRKLGGLGFRGFELDKRIDIPRSFARFTASRHFDIDLFIPRAKTGVEYNGRAHEEALRSAHDAERNSVLSMMGYTMFTLTRGQFASQLKLHRALNALAAACGITVDRTAAFQDAQNKLRLFAIRRWPQDQIG